jgi:hypothetical protein
MLLKDLRLMKKLLFYMPIVLLSALMIVMVVSTAFGQDTTVRLPHNADSFVNNFCFDGQVNELSLDEIVNTYTDMTNQYFNANIEYIMSNPTQEIPSINLNDYDSLGGGLCKDGQGGKVNDFACQAIALCNGSPAPYCVGATLLGFSPERYKNYDDDALTNYSQLKYSYFCYKAALDKKRNEIFDKSFVGENPTVTDLSQASIDRVKFIDDEIVRAKTALDQTLDAYSQLRSAWAMHVKYMDTFALLVKYRDYLVSIRKQTDTFPFKFIDATTTKCL